MRQSREREFEVRWRYFSLAQVNNSRAGWTAWDAPLEEAVPGRLAFMAAEFSRREGRFDAFHGLLLRMRHVDRKPLDQLETIRAAAEAAGLDWTSMRSALGERELLEAMRRDHLEGALSHGVFGTPTLVFPNGSAAYVKLRPAPAAAKAVVLFDDLCRLIATQPNLKELKRPPAGRPDG